MITLVARTDGLALRARRPRAVGVEMASSSRERAWWTHIYVY